MKRILLTKVLIISVLICIVLMSIFLYTQSDIFESADKEILTSAETHYLKSKKEIVFAGQKNYAPFEFINENGEYTGMGIELIRWISTEQGFKARFIPMNFNDAQAAVREGRADAMTGIFYSEERKKTFDFSSHVFTIPALIFVKADRPDIKDLYSLSGKTIAMQQGDYAYEFLQKKGITCSIRYTANFSDAADLVIRGDADALIGDEQIILYYLYSHRLSERLKKVGEPLYEGLDCMAVKSGETVLLGILEKGLKQARKNGVVNRLQTKWIGTYFHEKSSVIIKFVGATLILCIVLICSLILVWTWNRALRRVAASRTSLLEKEITEHKRTLEALGDSEERFRTLCVNTTDSIFWIRVTEDGRFIVDGANPAQIAALGQPEEQVIGRDIADVLPPDLSASIIENYRRCVAQRKALVYDEQVVLPLGFSVWQTVLVPQINAQGRVYRIIGTSRNITERKKAEDALRESEARNRGIIENASEVIYTLNREGIFLYVSPACTQILGHAVSEVIGKSFDQFVNPDDVFSCRDFIQRIVNTGMPQRLAEFRVQNKNGQWMYFTTTGSTVRGPGGAFEYYVGVALDISERKHLEQEHLELERRLLHTQKLESLGVLAGGIAHDFNNLLSAIMGNMELARESLAAPAFAGQYIHSAIQAARKAAELTLQMLAYSGKGSFLIEKINISDLVNDNIHIFRSSIPRTTSLELHLSAERPSIMADKGQVQQVIMNLITNAAEAIGVKPGILMISTGIEYYTAEDLKHNRFEVFPTPGNFVYLEVSDTGCGMDSETQLRLFDPFFTTKFTGRGLGMSALLGIVKGHKGAVFVKSEIGRGSTIRILFPASGEIIKSSTDAALNKAPALLPDVVSSLVHTVLIIDDEEMVLDMCANMLSGCGYTVVKAKDGQEGIELFKTHAAAVSCIILDLTMPRMDGFETFKNLHIIRPDVKIILSSGYSEQVATKPFKGLGLSGFVQKPYTLEELKREVQRVLG